MRKMSLSKTFIGSEQARASAGRHDPCNVKVLFCMHLEMAHILFNFMIKLL